MRSIISFFFCLLFSANLFAQKNLVLNPSFEDINGKLHCYFYGLEYFPFANWQSASNGSIDAFSALLEDKCIMNPYNPSVADQKPRTGRNYVGFTNIYEHDKEYREYVRGKLSEPLEVGATYKIEFYICLSNFANTTTNNIGLAFINNDTPIFKNTGTIPIQPDVNYSGKPISEADKWTLLSFDFVATKPDLDAFVIGNFFTIDQTKLEVLKEDEFKQAYLLLDDVTIYRKDIVFKIPQQICEGQHLELPKVSENGISGSWSPQFNNKATTTYTFTPVSKLYDPLEITINVTPKVVPEFDHFGPYCNQANIDFLPLISKNGIEGSWQPAWNKYKSQTYTFTPKDLSCTSTYSLQVEINKGFDFDILRYCENYQFFIEVQLNSNLNEQIDVVQWQLNGTLIKNNSTKLNVSDYSNLLREHNEVMVTLKDKGGCENAKKINFVNKNLCVIQKEISLNNDGIDDVLDLASFGKVKIKIFNRFGKVVYQNDLYTREWSGKSVEGEILPEGNYFYQIETNRNELLSGWIQLKY